MDNNFFGVFGKVVQSSVRGIINFGRQYQIAPAFYLIASIVGAVKQADKPVVPPAPVPAVPAYAPTPNTSTPINPIPPSPVSSNPGSTSNAAGSATSDSTNSTNSSDSTNPNDSANPTAIKVAKTRAYRNGDLLIIRFDRDVSNVEVSGDGESLKVSCKLMVCTTTLKEAAKAKVYWSQGADNFSTEFRL